MTQSRGYYESNRTGEYLGFPVTVIAMNVMYNGLHWHDHGEIIFCRKGQVKVRVDGTERILEQGDVTFINGGESHEIYDGRENELQIIAFIEPEAMGNLENRRISLEQLDEGDRKLVCEALGQMAYLSMSELVKYDLLEHRAAENGRKKYNRPEHVSADFDELRDAWNLSEENSCRYQMYMYQLLMVLMKYKVENVHPNEKKKDIIKKCVDYINEHLGDELNAAVLADQFHVSEPTVYRLFSEKIGLPLGQYITTVRINAVCRCLEETEDQITNIAMNCGFTGLSNFYRVFRQQVGVSPKEYRRHYLIKRQGQSRKRAVYQPEIMRLNRFQSFEELGIDTEELKTKIFL